MNAQHVTTHVADAQARFLEQYQGRPKAAALLAAFTQSVQKIEDALFGIEAGTALDTAQGAQLDLIGAIVGLARNGLEDGQYLALLRGAIAQNNGDATTESLLTVMRGLFQTSSLFLKQPNGARHAAQAAASTVSIGLGDPTVPPNVLTAMQAALQTTLGAGVALNYLSQFRAAAGSFAMAGNQLWVRGFGSVSDPQAGGGLAGLLKSQTAS